MDPRLLCHLQVSCCGIAGPRSSVHPGLRDRPSYSLPLHTKCSIPRATVHHLTRSQTELRWYMSASKSNTRTHASWLGFKRTENKQWQVLNAMGGPNYSYHWGTLRNIFINAIKSTLAQCKWYISIKPLVKLPRTQNDAANTPRVVHVDFVLMGKRVSWANVFLFGVRRCEGSKDSKPKPQRGQPRSSGSSMAMLLRSCVCVCACVSV